MLIRISWGQAFANGLYCRAFIIGSVDTPRPLCLLVLETQSGDYCRSYGILKGLEALGNGLFYFTIKTMWLYQALLLTQGRRMVELSLTPKLLAKVSISRAIKPLWMGLF